MDIPNVEEQTDQSYESDPISSKRERVYFSELEKMTLLDLIKDHIEIIDDKRNDNQIVKQKEEVWTDIQNKYHSWPGVVHRDKKQLKQLWKNLKIKTKKDLAELKENRGISEGSPAPKKKCLDQVSQMMCNILSDQEAFSLSIEDSHNVNDEAINIMIKSEPEDESQDGVHTPVFPVSHNPMAASSTPIKPSLVQPTTPTKTSVKPSPSKPLKFHTTSPRGIKRRFGGIKPGPDDNPSRARLLELAEEEHLAKMEVLAIKKQVQLIKQKYWQSKLESLDHA